MDSRQRTDQTSSGILPRVIKTIRAHPKTILVSYALIFISVLFSFMFFFLLFRNLLGLILGISSPFVVFVILWWKGRKRQSLTNRFEGENSPTKRSTGADKLDEDYLTNLIGFPTRFSFQDMEIATDKFSKEIGRGGFGKVYEGKLADATKVAVKCLLDEAGHGQREFYAEVATISSINHSNLVCLRGVCVEGHHRILVYEFMANGSLDKWLFGPENHLDWKTRYSIALNTDRGLAYLHDESRLCILHLDVKPQNILLDQDFYAKVSDFGLARSLNRDLESRVVTGMRGTPGYMAPEWLFESGITSKSDVFSYGMVLLEIIRGSKNVDNSQDSDNWYFPSIAFSKARQGKMDDLIDTALKLNRPRDIEEAYRLIKTALWCIQSNRALRPSMGTVVRILEGDLEIMEPPLDCQLPFAPSIGDKTETDIVGAVVYSEQQGAEAFNGNSSAKLEGDLEIMEPPLDCKLPFSPSINDKTDAEEGLVIMDPPLYRKLLLEDGTGQSQGGGEEFVASQPNVPQAEGEQASQEYAHHIVATRPAQLLEAYQNAMQSCQIVSPQSMRNFYLNTQHCIEGGAVREENTMEAVVEMPLHPTQNRMSVVLMQLSMLLMILLFHHYFMVEGEPKPRGNPNHKSLEIPCIDRVLRYSEHHKLTLPTHARDPPIDHWRTPSIIRKRKIYFSSDSDNDSERGDKKNSCIGGIQRHMYNFVYYGYDL